MASKNISMYHLNLVNSREIIKLLNNILNSINYNRAEYITSFDFYDGHPAEPVFWGFAFDIHSEGKRWIFLGSSSD